MNRGSWAALVVMATSLRSWAAWRPAALLALAPRRIAALLLVACAALIACSSEGPPSDAPEEEQLGSISEALTKPGGANGDEDYCNNTANKCVSGEGDCDLDSQCTGTGIKCLTDVGPKYNQPVGNDVCAPETCIDGIKQGNETAVDCGGACGRCPDVCVNRSGGANYVNGGNHFCRGCYCAAKEGDCDSTYECAPGLVCAGNFGPRFGFSDVTDVCVKPHCYDDIKNEDETGIDCGGADCGTCTLPCTGATAGGPDYCSACKCEAGKGDCDNARECKDGLQCLGNQGPRFGWSAATDVCLASHCGNNYQDADEDGIDCGGLDCGPCLPLCTGTAGPADFCVTCRCVTGQGDCDTNRECAPDLYCATNAGPAYGLPVGTDVCKPKACTSNANCPPEHYCSQSGECRHNGNPCTLPTQCGSEETCRNNRCDCATCSPGCTCEPGGPCNANEDCARELSCVDGSCQDCAIVDCGGGACVRDQDCQTNEYCSQTGVCETNATSCDSTAHCPIGLLCVAGACVDTTCQPDCVGKVCGAEDGCGDVCPGLCGLGDDCSTELDCGPGLFCKANECRPVECNDFALDRLDCGPNSLCGPCPEGPGGDGLPEDETEFKSNEIESFVPGAIVGQAGVSAAGSATYSIGLRIPPGRGDMTPELSLTYDSAGRADVLGDGWSVGGFSYITRCGLPATNTPPGSPDGASLRTRAGPRGHVYDGLCIDGERLIPRDDLNTVGVIEHGTVVPDFRKILLYPAADSADIGLPMNGEFYDHADHFEVYTTDGRILTYGNTEDTSVFTSRLGVKRAWALSKATDAFGNTIEFHYKTRRGVGISLGTYPDTEICDEDCATNEIVPDHIDYGGNTSGLEHSRRIQFVYDRRQDTAGPQASRQRSQTSFAVGTQISRTRRLNSIQAKVLNSVTQELETSHVYNLHYVPTTGQGDKLNGIYECVPTFLSYQCKEPTVFEYNAAPQPDEAFDEPFLVDEHFSPSFEDSPDASPIVADFNADGRDDLLIAIGYAPSGASQDSFEGGRWAWVEGTESLADLRAGRLNLGQPRLMNASPPTGFDEHRWVFGPVGDHDGDGHPEAYNVAPQHQPDQDAWALFGTSGTPIPNLLGFSDNRLKLPVEGAGTYTFMDFDGDSLLDFLTYDLQQNGTFWRKARIDGGFEPMEAVFSQRTYSTLDIDGDGRLEPIIKTQTSIFGGKTTLGFEAVDTLYGNIIAYFDEEVRDSQGIKTRYTKAELDINGDGLTDLLTRPSYERPEGAGYLKPVLANRPVRIRMGTGAGVTKELKLRSEVGSEEEDEFTFAEFASIRPIDFDNDGFTDFIALDEPTKTWKLYRSLGTRFDEAVTLSWPEQPGLFHHEVQVGDRYMAVNVPWSAVADFDGNGVQDFLYLADPGPAQASGIPRGQLVVVPGKGGTANLLAAATDGMGHRTEITYAFDAYEQRTEPLPGEPTAEPPCWPSTCLNKIGRPLVSEVVDFRRRGATSPGEPTVGDFVREGSVEYRFQDARMDAFGLGWIGFAGQTVRDFDAAGTLLETTTTRFDNTTYLDMFDVQSFYPYAGLPISVTTELPEVTSALASDGSKRKRSRVDFEWQTQLRSDQAWGGTLFPYLQFRTVTEYDGNTIVSMHTTDYFVNSFGETDFTQTNTYGFGTATGDEGVLLRTVEEDVGYDYDLWSDWVTAGIWRLPPVSRSTTVMEQPDDPDEESRLVQRHHEFAYDGLGEVESVTREPDDTDKLYLKTEYHRTPLGLVDSVTISDAHGATRVGKVEEFDDDAIFPKVTTEGFGTSLARSDTLIYDARFGVRISRTDPNDLTTTWDYDAFGRLTEIETPDGGGASFRLGYAEPATATQTGTVATDGVFKSIECPKGGGRSVQEIDSLGRVVRTKDIGLPDVVTDEPGEAPDCEDIDEGDYVYSEVAYDNAGRPEYESRPHANADDSQGIVRSYYNAAGELTQVDMPGQDTGTTDSVYYDSADVRSTSISASANPIAKNDWSGVVSRVIDALGNTTFNVTDAIGRRLTTLSPVGGRVDYRHDAAGNLRTTENDLGDYWSASYDTLGRTTAVSDPNRGDHTYEYNAFSELTHHSLPSGEEQLFGYDVLGRQIRSVSTRDGRRCWFYDQGPNAMDRLTLRAVGTACPSAPDDPASIETPEENHVAYAYDAQGRLLTETYLIDEGAAHEKSLAFTYGYTADGDIATLQYPSAGSFAPKVEYGYHARSGTQVALRNANATSTVYWRLNSTTQHYQVKQQQFGQHITVDNEHYATTGHLKRLRTRSSATPTPTTLADNRYSFDPNGNLQTRRDVERSGSLETFEYDENDRLKTVRNSADVVTMALTYATNGNILTKSGVGSFEYLDPRVGGGYRAHAASTAGSMELGYDSLGNQTWRNLGSAVQDIEYTHFGLPRRIDQTTATTGSHVAFDYDANGVRIARSELDEFDQVTQKRIYADDLYEVAWSTANATEEHIFKLIVDGTQVAQLEATTSSGTLQGTPALVYLHGDGLGSTELITTSSGSVLKHQVWGAFGESTTLVNGANKVRAGYTGHEQEDALGLINMGGRFFDAKLGRFLSPDPLFNDDSSDGLNGYSYVLNNPLTFSDPSGFDPPKKQPPPPPQNSERLFRECSANEKAPGCAAFNKWVKKYGAPGGLTANSPGKPKAGAAPPRDPATPGKGSDTASSGDAKGSDPDAGGGEKPPGSADRSGRQGSAPKGPSQPLTPPPDPDAREKTMAAKEGAIMRWMLAGVAVWRTSGAANLGGIPEGWCRTNCVSGPLVQGLRLGLELIGRGAGQAKKAAQHAASWIWKATRKITDKAAEKAAKGAKALAAKAARGVQKAVRGRFRRGSDDLDQLDGVEAHKGKLKPNHRAEEGDKVRDAIDSIEKSEKRLDNRLDRVKNLKDAIDEFGE